MLEKTIIGIDLEVNSKNNPLYAICLISNGHTYQILENRTVLQLIELIENYEIVVLAVDSLGEIKISKQLYDYLSMKNIEVRQVTSDNKKLTSLVSQINKIDLKSYHKPNPLKTAIYCALLCKNNIGDSISINISNQDLDNSESRNNFTHSEYKHKSVDKNILNLEYTNKHAYEYLNHNPFIKCVIRTVHTGKEATVFLISTIEEEVLIVKLFKKYSTSAKQIQANGYHIRSYNIPMIMSKYEAKILQELNDSGYTPKFFRRDASFLMMEAILVKSEMSDYNYQVAPQISNLDFRQYNIDPIDIVYQLLDYYFELFSKYQIVHNDFSPQNILFDGEKCWIVDFSLSKRINYKTFTETSERIRIDEALSITIRDLNNLLDFFERKYRLEFDRAYIFKQFRQSIPEMFQSRLEL
jgi:RIO-like serine/threonine protein kinase